MVGKSAKSINLVLGPGFNRAMAYTLPHYRVFIDNTPKEESS